MSNAKYFGMKSCRIFRAGKPRLGKKFWSVLKKNHSINVTALNKAASDRLAELYIEAESLISLRLTGTHRVYGYMNGAVFNILWVDLNHGDNTSCVCRAHKK